MDLDLRLQRLFDRVELVSGIGTPGLGQMCVMSFAACLAGEGHTDHPSGVSPVIRSFAILLNDQMPTEIRQRLKPFAPRVLGTNDGLDSLRAELLRSALVDRLLPRATEKTAPRSIPELAGRLGRFWRGLRSRHVRMQMQKMLQRAEQSCRPGHELRGTQLAHAAVSLISLRARHADNRDEAEWYWNEAVALLDRMCDIGGARHALELVRADRVGWLETVLEHRRRAALSNEGSMASSVASRPSP